jgi:hypothetical protein
MNFGSEETESGIAILWAIAAVIVINALVCAFENILMISDR